MAILLVVAAIAARCSSVEAIWRGRINSEIFTTKLEPGSGICDPDRARQAEEDGCCSTTMTTTHHGPTCIAWADPHISSFDNTQGDQGPDYLSLTDRKTHGSRFTTIFASFDGHHSKVLRPNASVGSKSSGEGNHSFDAKARHHSQKNGSAKSAPTVGEGNSSLDVNAYDAGDFWLVKSIPVYIQGRFRLAQEFLPDNAAIGAVSIGGPFLNGHTIIIEPLDGDATLDGAPMPSGSFLQQSEAGNLTMTYVAKKGKTEAYADFEAELPMNVRVTLRRWMRHLDVKIKMPDKIPGGVDGECGNMNGDASDDGQDAVHDRMEELQVSEKDKLFMKKFPVWVQTDKLGFEAVQATKDADTVRKFIRLLLAKRGAQLMSESELSGILPYYTGEEETNSYDDLLEELNDADWVQGFDSGSWSLGPIIESILGAIAWEKSPSV